MEYLIAGFLLLFVLDSNKPKNRIVLLDNNSAQNEVIVKSKDGQKVIGAPFESLSVSDDGTKISKIRKVDKAGFMKEYGDIINKSIVKPTSLLFYFNTGSDELTLESQKNLEKIPVAIREHFPCEVTIIGHADRQGSDEKNIRISIQRAKKVYDWLKEQNLNVVSIKTKSFGENDPIIPTEDGVAEPLNRRVEVLIR